MNCEIEVDECGSNPCNNGAVCLDKIAKFECECNPGEWASNPLNSIFNVTII